MTQVWFYLDIFDCYTIVVETVFKNVSETSENNAQTVMSDTYNNIGHKSYFPYQRFRSVMNNIPIDIRCLVI